MREVPEDFPVLQFLVKTNIGAEQYCGAEIQEVLQATGLDDIFYVVA